MALITACSSTPKQTATEAEASRLPYTIDLSEVEFSHEPQCLSEFADSIEYIMLSDSVLLPDIFHLRWLLDKDDNIYIEHGNIEKFTPEGKHVKSLLKIGQGPGKLPTNFPLRKLLSISMTTMYMYLTTENTIIANSHWMENIWVLSTKWIVCTISVNIWPY